MTEQTDAKAKAQVETHDAGTIKAQEISEKAAGLRQKAEEIARGKATHFPEDLDALPPEEIRKMVHELRGHQIELEIQNEELRRTQVELEASRTRYFELFDLAPVGYLTLNEEGLILEANLTAARLLGVARNELVTQPVSRFILKENQDIYYCHRKKLFETGEPRTCELQMGKKDGTAFWARMESTIVQDAGEAPMCQVVMSDITLYKRVVDDALRESEEQLLAISTNLADGMVYQIDSGKDGRERRFTFISPAVERMHGLSVAEIMQNPAVLYGQVIPEDLARVSEQEEKSFRTSTPLDIEVRVLLSSGQVRWRRFISSPRKTADGNILWDGIELDITDQKRAAELFKSQFINSPDIILIIDRDYKIEVINRIAAGDFTTENLKGRDSIEILPPEHQDSVRQSISKCFETGEIQEFEHSIGDGKWVRSRVVAMTDDGAISRVMILSMDITERKQAEEEKDKLEAQLQQAQKMESVGRLAGGVAHDFNNMLGVILGHVEMALEQEGLPQPLHDDLVEIRKAAERSADLTRQLLAFARKQMVSPIVMNLNDTITGTLKMLQRLIGEDIHIVWHPDANLWPVWVDSSQIDQILVNLCVNARDAIENVGKITIKTANITFDEVYCSNHAGFFPGEYVTLSVNDDGCGMDKETLAHIFEPFFTTKGVGEGTGLGLAMVYGAVKQNNGFINVYSEPGQGTRFTIYLPRYITKTEHARAEGVSEPISHSLETILLVEDELAILRMVKMMLEKQGYTVLSANTPGEAIHLAREHAGEIHLLMTDVVMPEMNGRDLARKLLSLYPSLKRLFMSGYAPDSIAHRGMLDEGVYLIQKPFTIKELTVKVRKVLDGEP